ncbi:(2Fe-2S)-binding protein [Pseudactinotalea sp. HY158]|uniref:(2Fe-2S)-binding protein n=1 Tax=Pseudactinotalea sp. HY158 TaxID=2654547 RepID=UPI00129CF397|nr:(2Fe-2S)-binding protein [Pseudactinotalea sp. HY158]QGH70701.1 2Fe-2S iron-sulfur cluster binding domain-containing protein [Pseudactinotalea sp. HY158]
MKVRLTVNGEDREVEVEPRRLLSDVLRHELDCQGVHLGCEHGVCGACTVIMDGVAVRSCLTLAPQAEGTTVLTTEGLGTPEHPSVVQRAFKTEHGLQCGFCTPGFVCAITAMLDDVDEMDDGELREALAGNICRCTGYANIVKAARRAAAERDESDSVIRQGGGCCGEQRGCCNG